MSFWLGKNESLLQSLVEAVFKSVLSGLVIVVFARFLIVMVDSQIEVASKRDALNTFKNDQLSKATTRFANAYLAADCTQSLQTVSTDECRSNIGSFLDELYVISLELKAHYPNAASTNLQELKDLAEAMYHAPVQVVQKDIDNLATTFGATLEEMAQNFR